MDGGMWIEHCGGDVTWVPTAQMGLTRWLTDSELEALVEAEPEAVAA